MSKVSVGIGKTYNTGNYQSLRLDVGFEEELKCGDDMSDRFYYLYDMAKDLLGEIEKDQGVK